MTPFVTPEELGKVLHVSDTAELVVLACDAANGVIAAYLDPAIDHTDHPWDRSAALTLATDIYQNYTASGGEIVGPDYTVYPFRMGPALLNRVMGLIAQCTPLEAQ